MRRTAVRLYAGGNSILRKNNPCASSPHWFRYSGKYAGIRRDHVSRDRGSGVAKRKGAEYAVDR